MAHQKRKKRFDALLPNAEFICCAQVAFIKQEALEKAREVKVKVFRKYRDNVFSMLYGNSCVRRPMKSSTSRRQS